MGTYLNLIITKRNGNRVPVQNRRTATRIVSGKQTWALLNEDKVEISVQSPYPQTYDIGDAINVFGRTYTLNRLPKVKRTGANEFTYDLEFEGVQYMLARAMYDVTIDTTTNKLQDVQGDSLTGDLKRFASVLLSNANRVFPSRFAMGDCPETDGDKTLTFGESDNCLSVLQTLCNESNFNVEFSIDYKQGVYYINFAEKIGKTLPYTFVYGRGGGLYQLNRENVSTANIITRLKVYGSTENITSKYRADRLCLPGKSKGQSYIEDADAIAKFGIFEGRKNFDVKPTFTGKIESTNGILEFVDTSFPFDINEKEKDGVTTKYLVDGADAKIHFNTGNLAGYEFTLTKYDHATHTFTIKKFTDDRGDVFPSETSKAFQFAVGDKYKIIDIAYSGDINNAAEEELQTQGETYYNQNSQPKVQYGLQVTKAWLQNAVGASESTIINVFEPGDYLHVEDVALNVNKDVRIKSFTRNLLDVYDYSLTLGDTIERTITTRVISELIDIDKTLTINNLKDPVRARANWRTSREVLDMVFDPEGDYYTDKIKPSSIDTLMLSVGAKSMQFGLIGTAFHPNSNANPNYIVWEGGILEHYTINEEQAVAWSLADGSAVLIDGTQAYYIYAKCEKNGTAGTIVFDTSQHKVNEDANYYWFWIGVLNSVDDVTNTREISLTYGFTTINGSHIETGRIESGDGVTYFDLDAGEIGGKIKFRANDGTTKNVADLEQQTSELNDFVGTTIVSQLKELQSQVDGQIEQWFYEVDPTTTNEPTATWIAADAETGGTEERDKHVGDLYYNTATGAVFRYIRVRIYSITGVAVSKYNWTQLSDDALASALAAANNALALSQTKRRVFVNTPYPPYDEGDLWVQGENGDIMRCVTSREDGVYNADDWEKASKYTDDAALTTFINGAYAKQVETFTSQIDGKIETWFETTPPSRRWRTDETRAKHVGDMWYNINTKELKIYTATTTTDSKTTYAWKNIEDAQAIAAYEAASNAQDTADGKRRVFVDTPYPPYDEGDLWLTGGSVDGQLFRCITARADGETYLANDWVEAVYYDNTQTTIDGGIVTGGTIQVAGDKAYILAGITGNGTTAESIRMWAGATFENRANAPFRVQQDGKVYATNLHISGDSTFGGALNGATGSFKKLICVNALGNEVGSITFNSDGRLTFAGDISIQGTNGTRNYNLYGTNIYARGMFGARYRTMVRVVGATAYYYANGIDKTPITKSLIKSTDSSGNAYYTLDLYPTPTIFGTASQYKSLLGMPVDTIVFANNSNTLYRYSLSMAETQRCMVVNACNNYNNVRIYCASGEVTWNGGEVAEVVKLANCIIPSQVSTQLGCGIIVGAFRDNNWK